MIVHAVYKNASHVRVNGTLRRHGDQGSLDKYEEDRNNDELM